MGGPAWRTAFAALEDVPACLYLVGRDCRIAAMTARAREFLRWARVLTLRSERLCLQGDESGLVSAVREVTAEGRAPGAPHPFRLLALSTASGGGHLRVAAAGRALPGLACVTVGPLAAQQMAAIGVPLRCLYGLTPAEADLCECLKVGATLDQAAQMLAIRRSTAVSQLKSVFAKTDTGRQAELLRLLLDLAAVC
ncbi:MAG: helix-turn-helix transcriptional regulator [Pseudomonadota bacterium]